MLLRYDLVGNRDMVCRAASYRLPHKVWRKEGEEQAMGLFLRASRDLAFGQHCIPQQAGDSSLQILNVPVILPALDPRSFKKHSVPPFSR